MWQETLLTILALQFVNHTDSFLVPSVLYTLGCLAVLVRDISVVYWGAGEASISFRPAQPDQSPTVCLFIETWSLYVTLLVLDLGTLTRLSLNPQRISLPLPMHTLPHLEVCTL